MSYRAMLVALYRALVAPGAVGCGSCSHFHKNGRSDALPCKCACHPARELIEATGGF